MKASLGIAGALPDFFFKEFNDITEASGVLGVCARQGLVSFEHMFGLLDFVDGVDGLLTGAELGIHRLTLDIILRAGVIDFQNVIQTQAAEKLLIASVGIEDADLTFAELTQMQGCTGEGAEESAVHDRAAFQIHDKVAGALLHHGLEAPFHLHAVHEGTFAFDSHPEEITDLSDQDGG
jgi:hypothetical protein